MIMKLCIYLASIALPSTCRHFTVIRTSAPNAINLDLRRLANLQNKLKHNKKINLYRYIKINLNLK